MPARFAEDVITGNERSVPLNLGGHYNQHSAINDDIVITGFSGRLPESSSIEEFKRNLYDGVDLVNGDPRRWERGNATSSKTTFLFVIIFILCLNFHILYCRSLWIT